MPRITVTIPTYNYSAVLRYSIASVLRQTMEDFELLVVGDGCTDDSEEVVRSFNDSRVQWINLPENCGEQTGPNNEGIKKASAPVVMHVGHDDLLMPYTLEVMTNAVEAGADLAHGIISSQTLEGTSFFANETLGDYLGGGMSPTAVAYRTEATQKIGLWKMSRDIPEGRVNPDTDFFRRLKAVGCRFEFVPRVVAIKFSAAKRPNCYVEKPSHEQKAFLERISSEPDFEPREMFRLMQHLEEQGRRGRVYGIAGHGKAALRAAWKKVSRTVGTREKAPPGTRLDERKRIRGVPVKPRES